MAVYFESHWSDEDGRQAVLLPVFEERQRDLFEALGHKDIRISDEGLLLDVVDVTVFEHIGQVFGVGVGGVETLQHDGKVPAGVVERVLWRCMGLGKVLEARGHGAEAAELVRMDLVASDDLGLLEGGRGDLVSGCLLQ